MTITEFLLARIAEDEAKCGNIIDHRGEWDGIPARVLAECEAKRRIVNLHHETRASESYMGDDFDPACTGFDDPAPARTSECDTLRTLASVYADHPDFDPAWRVAD